MFQGRRFTDTLARVQALKALSAPHYATMAEAAMRFVLSESAVSAVIPGMTSRAEVDMNVAYSDGAAFPATLKADVAAHTWVRNYYWETKD
jgi:aryl-alcohol dehydrogenase-like predicted oxidoreductase